MHRIKVEFCSEVDEDHRESARAYAHTFHRRGVICVARAFETLPEGFQLGILLHEIGHLSLGDDDHREAMIDQIVYNLFEIPIERRRFRRATKLEYVDWYHVDKAEQIIRRLTNYGQAT